MRKPNERVAFAALLAVAVFCAPAAAQAPSQLARGNSYTITGKILTFDPATRAITLEGPLGGVLDAVVSTDVSDISKIKPGSMVEASYVEAVAAAVRREGEAKPLLSAAEVAAKAHPGMPADAAAISESLTVFSVDPGNNTVVFQDKDRTLHVVEVERPEFRAKLKDIKPGDVVDVTYSAALVQGIRPVAAGEKPKLTMKSGTLVIERGEVVKRLDTILLIRNEAGRTIRAKVDPKQKLILNGKEATVYDLKPGAKLTRTALRVSEASYSE